jgi:hypothetical protein
MQSLVDTGYPDFLGRIENAMSEKGYSSAAEIEACSGRPGSQRRRN